MVGTYCTGCKGERGGGGGVGATVVPFTGPGGHVSWWTVMMCVLVAQRTRADDPKSLRLAVLRSCHQKKPSVYPRRNLSLRGETEF